MLLVANILKARFQLSSRIKLLGSRQTCMALSTTFCAIRGATILIMAISGAAAYKKKNDRS